MNNVDLIEEKIKDGVDNQDLIDLTAQVKDANFCENFADQLKTQEGKLVDAIKICVDKCNSDVEIRTLEDFLKSLEDKSGDYTDLKAVLKAKIDEYNTPDKNKTPANTVVVDDLQKQANQAYTALDDLKQNKGIEKNVVEKVTDYLRDNKDNQGLRALVNSLDETTGIYVGSAGDWTINKNIGNADDFAKKVEGMGLPKLDLKAKEETVDNTKSTEGKPNLRSDTFADIQKTPENFKKEMQDRIKNLDNNKESPESIKMFKAHDQFPKLEESINNIKTHKDMLYTAKIGINILNDIIQNPIVQKEAETEIKKHNSSSTVDQIKNIISTINTTIDQIYNKTKDMSSEDFDKARKDGSIQKMINTSTNLDPNQYKFQISGDINNLKAHNEFLTKTAKEYLKKIAGAKDQNEINVVIKNFITDCDNNKDIVQDKDWIKLKNTLESRISIPKEDLEFVINSMQNGDLDFVTAKLEANKKKTEAQEKLNKENDKGALEGFLTQPLDGTSKVKDQNGVEVEKDNIKIVSEGLFENNEGAYNQLFDEKVLEQLNSTQQKNLTRLIYTYLHKNADFSEHSSLKDITFKKIQKGEKSTYPEGTNIIFLKTDPLTQIAFGSYDHVQEQKTSIVTDVEITRFKDVLKNAPETIFLELANKGSYMLLEKVLNSYTDQDEKISVLNSLVSKDIIGSIKNAAGKAAPDSKDPNFESQKLLTQQSDIQKEGYINIIRNQVGEILKTVPKLGEKSAAVDLFQSYVKQCESNSAYLGNDIQTRMNNHNNLFGIRKGLLQKDKNYEMKIDSLTADQLKADPYALRDKNITTTIQNLYKGGLAEYNEKNGMKAQLEGLFGQFKDQIMMVAEFLGFSKEDALHRFGMNKGLRDAVNAAYEKAYKLDDKDKAVISKMHNENSDYIKNLNELSAKIKDEKGEYIQDEKKIIDTFKDNTSGENFVTELKKSGANEFNIDRTFISGLISSYNKDKPTADQIQYKIGDDPSKVNPGREEVVKKAWKDPLIRDTIKNSSDVLGTMAKTQNIGKKNERPSTYTEANNSTIQNLAANPLTAVSYYLSTMVLAGQKDLHYKVSENRDKKSTPEKKPDVKVETPKEKLTKDASLATEKDGVYTITTEGAKKKIHEIIDASDKGPKMLVVTDKGGKESFAIKGKDGTQDTFVDSKTGKRSIILEGYTIKEASQAQIDSYEGESKVTKAITDVETWLTTADKNATDYDKNFKDKVTTPIFNLFTAENTYDYMHSHDTEDKTIQDPTTFKKIFDYAQNKDKTDGITIDGITSVVVKSGGEKITFEVTDDKSATQLLTMNNKGKFEKASAPVKTPEQKSTPDPYSSIDALRTSLGYTKGSEKPKDYDTKLEETFLKDGLTTEQKTVIAKEIARANMEVAKKNNMLDIAGSKAGTTMLDGKVKDGGKLSYDVKKTSDTEVEISINEFKITAKIEEVTKPAA